MSSNGGGGDRGAADRWDDDSALVLIGPAATVLFDSTETRCILGDTSLERSATGRRIVGNMFGNMLARET